MTIVEVGLYDEEVQYDVSPKEVIERPTLVSLIGENAVAVLEAYATQQAEIRYEQKRQHFMALYNKGYK